MTEITRRATLTGAAAAAVVPLAATLPASAAAPVSGKQAPAYYRYKVGDFVASRLVWQERFDGGPFTIGEFVAHDSGTGLGA